MEFVQNEAGEWFWRHIAANGEQLSRSSETYERELSAADSAKASLGDARVSGMEVKRFPRGTPDPRR